MIEEVTAGPRGRLELSGRCVKILNVVEVDNARAISPHAPVKTVQDRHRVDHIVANSVRSGELLEPVLRHRDVTRLAQPFDQPAALKVNYVPEVHAAMNPKDIDRNPGKPLSGVRCTPERKQPSLMIRVVGVSGMLYGRVSSHISILR